MTDYTQVLTRKFARKLWRLDGDDYTGLAWLDDSPKPSQTELDALWPDVQQEIAEETAAAQQARDAAIAHAKSLGFTDEMIVVMYPNLRTV